MAQQVSLLPGVCMPCIDHYPGSLQICNGSAALLCHCNLSVPCIGTFFFMPILAECVGCSSWMLKSLPHATDLGW